MLRGHTTSVRDVAYSPTGRHLASASLDGAVKLWTADTGVQVGMILLEHCHSFSEDLFLLLLTHYLTVAPLYSFTSYRMVTLKCSFIENRMITPFCAMRTTMLFIYMMALKQGHFLSFSENQTPVAVSFPFINCIVYF